MALLRKIKTYFVGSILLRVSVYYLGVVLEARGQVPVEHIYEQATVWAGPTLSSLLVGTPFLA